MRQNCVDFVTWLCGRGAPSFWLDWSTSGVQFEFSQSNVNFQEDHEKAKGKQIEFWDGLYISNPKSYKTFDMCLIYWCWKIDISSIEKISQGIKYILINKLQNADQEKF